MPLPVPEKEPGWLVLVSFPDSRAAGEGPGSVDEVTSRAWGRREVQLPDSFQGQGWEEK